MLYLLLYCVFINWIRSFVLFIALSQVSKTVHGTLKVFNEYLLKEWTIKCFEFVGENMPSFDSFQVEIEIIWNSPWAIRKASYYNVVMRGITLESWVTDLGSKILLAFLFCAAYISSAFPKYLLSEGHLEGFMHFGHFIGWKIISRMISFERHF